MPTETVDETKIDTADMTTSAFQVPAQESRPPHPAIGTTWRWRCGCGSVSFATFATKADAETYGAIHEETHRR